MRGRVLGSAAYPVLSLFTVGCVILPSRREPEAQRGKTSLLKRGTINFGSCSPAPSQLPDFQGSPGRTQVPAEVEDRAEGLLPWHLNALRKPKEGVV